MRRRIGFHAGVPGAAVRGQTGKGAKNIGVADGPAGRHRLDLTTSNGSITVKPGCLGARAVQPKPLVQNRCLAGTADDRLIM